MRVPSDVPRGRDDGRVCPARVHDYLLGGEQHFSFDRDFTAEHAGALSVVRHLLKLERKFLTDAVLLMLRRGIRQFLDLGAGLPSAGGVYETTSYLQTRSVVVHVDNDVAAVDHGRMLLLDGTGCGRYLSADVTEPHHVMSSCVRRRWLDPAQPIGLIAVGVLDLLDPAYAPERLLAHYCEWLSPDSMVALTCRTPGFAAGQTPSAAALIAGGGVVHPRGDDVVRSLFADLTMIKPGVVALPHQWPGLPRHATARVRGMTSRAVLAGIAAKDH